MTDPRSLNYPETDRNAVTLAQLGGIELQIRYFSLGAFLLVMSGVGIGVWATYQFTLSADDLSKLGDFFAGTVAALWSLAGLLLIYVAFLGQRRQILHQEEELHLNRIELKGTREELRGQKEQLEQQTIAANQQRFENTFFQRLQLLNSIADSIRIEGQTLQLGPRVLVQQGAGREVFRLLVEELEARIAGGRTQGAQDAPVVGAWQELLARHESRVGHYFRTLHHLLRFVDSSGLPYPVRKEHLDILRAQLSVHELVLLYYACVIGYLPTDLKILVEKYALFAFLPPFERAADVNRAEFSPAAFDDSLLTSLNS